MMQFPDTDPDALEPACLLCGVPMDAADWAEGMRLCPHCEAREQEYRVERRAEEHEFLTQAAERLLPEW